MHTHHASYLHQPPLHTQVVVVTVVRATAQPSPSENDREPQRGPQAASTRESAGSSSIAVPESETQVSPTTRDDAEQVPMLEWMEEPGKAAQEEMTPMPSAAASAAAPASAASQPPSTTAEVISATKENLKKEMDWAVGKDQVMDTQGKVLSEPKSGPQLRDRRDRGRQLKSDERPLSPSSLRPRSPTTFKEAKNRIPSPAEASTLGMDTIEDAGPGEISKTGVDPQEQLITKGDRLEQFRNVVLLTGLLGLVTLTGYVGYDIFRSSKEAVSDLGTGAGPDILNAPLSASSFLLNWVNKPKSPQEIGLGVGASAIALILGGWGVSSIQKRLSRLARRVQEQLIVFSRYALVTGILVLIAYILTRD